MRRAGFFDSLLDGEREGALFTRRLRSCVKCATAIFDRTIALRGLLLHLRMALLAVENYFQSGLVTRSAPPQVDPHSRCQCRDDTQGGLALRADNPTPKMSISLAQTVSPTVSQIGLDRVAIGGSGLVLRVDGDDALTLRLMEMGFVPGVRVHVAKAAPMLDPLELELRGYHVSLRRAQASRILVAPLKQGDDSP